MELTGSGRSDAAECITIRQTALGGKKPIQISFVILLHLIAVNERSASLAKAHPRSPATSTYGETAGSRDPAAVRVGWQAGNRRSVEDSRRLLKLPGVSIHFISLARVLPDPTGSKSRAINQSAELDSGSGPIHDRNRAGASIRARTACLRLPQVVTIRVRNDHLSPLLLER